MNRERTILAPVFNMPNITDQTVNVWIARSLTSFRSLPVLQKKRSASGAALKPPTSSLHPGGRPPLPLGRIKLKAINGPKS